MDRSDLHAAPSRDRATGAQRIRISVMHHLAELVRLPIGVPLPGDSLGDNVGHFLPAGTTPRRTSDFTFAVPTSPSFTWLAPSSVDYSWSAESRRLNQRRPVSNSTRATPLQTAF
jgi:hypothetical protein